MKSLLKYITLLLVSGVIVPFYLHLGNIKDKPVIVAGKGWATYNAVKNDVIRFSFTDDVAANLLPVIKILHPSVTFSRVSASY